MFYGLWWFYKKKKGGISKKNKVTEGVSEWDKLGEEVAFRGDLFGEKRKEKVELREWKEKEDPYFKKQPRVENLKKEDFLEIEGVIKLRMNSDGEHLSAVDMLGDTFEAVAVNTPVLPTSADGIFKFITN